MQHGLGDRVEGPGADDLVGLRAHVRGEELRVALGIEEPVRADLRGERAGEPGVEHVGIARVAAGLVALRLHEAGGRLAHRIDGQARGLRQDRVLVVPRSVGEHRVPRRDRHAEVALPRHAPVDAQVLGPVAVARAHELGVPVDRVALLEELLLLIEEAHEPLARGHELERAIALLVEAHRMGDGLGIALKRRAAFARHVRRGAAARILEQLDDALLRLVDRLALELRVERVGGLGLLRRVLGGAEGDLAQPPIAAEDLAEGQLLLAPPEHVGLITEGAHHEDAAALGGIGELAREDLHRREEQGGHRVLAEEVLVAGVIGVRAHGHARGQELGAGGGDHERLVRAFDAELEVVIRAGSLLVGDLGLRNRRLEVDVPHGRRFELIRALLLEEIEERELREVPAAIIDGRVGLRPVDRQREAAEEAFEDLLILPGHDVTELDEVLTGDEARLLALALLVGGRLEGEPRLVGHVRVAAHVEIDLNAPLRGQAVVVPAHGIEDVLAQHALVARHHVGLRVGEHVPEVERAADRRGRGVDDEVVRASLARIPAVGREALPGLVPADLGALGLEVGGEGRRIDDLNALRHDGWEA